MKTLVLLFTLFYTNSIVWAQTQSDMNQQAYHDFQVADQELNQVYQQVLDAYQSDTVFIQNLRASQRIWIQFRDAEVAMKYPRREPGYYGSSLLTCTSAYLTDLTEVRAHKLKEWLTNPPEGDVCSGSVKRE